MNLVEVGFQVNGQRWTGAMPAHRTLIEVLREDLFLTGVKLSCNQAVCGACTVLLDGKPVASCSTFAFEADNTEIETVEGLAEANTELSPLQEAFVKLKAFQCGFCTPGMLMAAKALLSEYEQPDSNTIRCWLAGNVCRCTGYKMIVEAVEEASHGTASEF